MIELKVHYNDNLVRTCIEGLKINAETFIEEYLVNGTDQDKDQIRQDFARLTTI